MSLIVSIIFITAIAGVGGTGLGAIVSAMFKKDSSKIVSLLLSFAGGVMLSVVCFDLISDTLESSYPSDTANLFIVMGGVLVGYLVIYFLNLWIDRSTNHEIKHIDKNHPKTADSLEELIHSDHLQEHKKTKNNLFIDGVVMACAIALHNMPEGMVIGASFATAAGAEQLSRGGMALAIVIGLHNIPEGMAVAVPLISGGMNKLKAISVTALSGAPTIIGAIIGYYLGTIGPIALSISLSFASGAMLYVVFGELLPEAILMWRSKLPAFSTIVGMLIGLIIIYL